jgi:STE24 endopeptidase
MMPIENAISRKLETDADIMALKMAGDEEAFISLMERLAEKNLSDPNPNRLIELLFYSHPPISKRIALAKKPCQR